MKKEHLHELLYQALETELGGVEVYKTALRCAVNERPARRSGRSTSSRPRTTSAIVREMFATLGLDPEVETPGRPSCGTSASRWCRPWRWRSKAGDRTRPQLVAAECVVLAETKDHLNWELIGEVAKSAQGRGGQGASRTRYEQVEDEEDEHLYHTTGWTPRALDRVARHAGRASSARGGEGRQDGDRRRARQAGPRGDAALEGTPPRERRGHVRGRFRGGEGGV